MLQLRQVFSLVFLYTMYSEKKLLSSDNAFFGFFFHLSSPSIITVLFLLD